MSKNSRMKPVFHFQKFSFFLPVHSEVIEISVETYVEGFGPVGNFVLIEQRDFFLFPIG